MRLLIALAAIAMTGCAALQSQDAVRMTPEQLAAWAKDKNANAFCSRVLAAGYSGVVTMATLDQNTIKGAGKIIVNPENCGMEIQTAPAEAKTTAPVVVKP